jgi:NMD protein affecting ribosome stability and mRNA decay
MKKSGYEILGHLKGTMPKKGIEEMLQKLGNGEFLKKHREEILNRIKNIVDEVMSQRPLQRILWLEEKEDGSIEIATTSEHLARHLGEAINSAFKGEFDFKYNEGEKLVRVFWHRD